MAGMIDEVTVAQGEGLAAEAAVAEVVLVAGAVDGVVLVQEEILENLVYMADKVTGMQKENLGNLAVVEIGIDATEVDATEVDATEVDTTEVDATEVDATEVDATEVDATEVDAFP